MTLLVGSVVSSLVLLIAALGYWSFGKNRGSRQDRVSDNWLNERRRDD